MYSYTRKVARALGKFYQEKSNPSPKPSSSTPSLKAPTKIKKKQTQKCAINSDNCSYSKPESLLCSVLSPTDCA